MNTLGQRLSEYAPSREWVQRFSDEPSLAVQALEDWRIAAGEVVPDAVDHDPPSMQTVVQLRKLADLLRTYLDIEWPYLSVDSTVVVADALYAVVRPVRRIHDPSSPRGTRTERRPRPDSETLHASMTKAVQEIDRATNAILMKADFTAKTEAPPAVTGELSPPMSRQEAARRLFDDDGARWRKAEPILRDRIIEIEGASKVQFRLDGLSESNKERLRTPRK